MGDNLVLNGDFQQANGGCTCGPGCAIQAQRPCTGRCAILRPPQTLSQLINGEQAQIGQTMNFTAQVLAISTTLNSKTKQVDVLVSFGNNTIEHSISIYSPLEIAPFSTYTQNVTLQSTSTPMIIHLRDEIDIYDYNVYIQSISLAAITPHSTASTVSDDTADQLKEIARHQITLVAIGVLVPTAVIILLMVCGTVWWLRRQRRRLLQGGAGPPIELTPANNQTSGLRPQVVSLRTQELPGRSGFGSSASHLPLDLDTVNSKRRSVELPSTPLEHSPEIAEPEDTRSRPSIIDDPIGQYAAIYRNKISRQLEDKLRTASFMPHHDPNAITEEEWLRELNVGPFELERLKEIFNGRWGPPPPSQSADQSMASLRSGYPYPLDKSARGAEHSAPPTGLALEDWAEEHRTLVSSELEAKLRSTCYQPQDNPDRLPPALWQSRLGVGGFELQILRQLFRQQSTSLMWIANDIECYGDFHGGSRRRRRCLRAGE